MSEFDSRVMPGLTVCPSQAPGPPAGEIEQMNLPAENIIEIRVNEIAQLFHTLDPFPFREKDLDREAEEYIVGWARELPPKLPFKIIVHFPEDEAQTRAAGEMREAFGRYFTEKFQFNLLNTFINNGHFLGTTNSSLP